MRTADEKIPNAFAESFLFLRNSLSNFQLKELEDLFPLLRNPNPVWETKSN